MNWNLEANLLVCDIDLYTAIFLNRKNKENKAENLKLKKEKSFKHPFITFTLMIIFYSGVKVNVSPFKL